MVSSEPRLICANDSYAEARRPEIWDHLNLTYAARDRVLWDPLTESCEMWGALCGLTFRRHTGAYGLADIYVLEVDYIDGPGGVLARMYYPPVGRGEFDPAEAWTWPMRKYVSDHEIGHGIGLPHVDRLTSTMNPFYRGTASHHEPDEDDIAAVVERYGPPVESPVQVGRRVDWRYAGAFEEPGWPADADFLVKTITAGDVTAGHYVDASELGLGIAAEFLVPGWMVAERNG